MNVELIYDANCPNVSAARSLLIKAYTRTGVSARWREWERSVPAVVVNGKLADCCTGRGPDERQLPAASVGQPL